jgi:DNA-binding MarR family transcriptional regulator
LSTDFPQALGRLRIALDDAFVRSSREVGLTPQQAELLCAAMTPSPVRDLAVTLRCDRSNVTRLVDRAAARGHVSRAVEDDDGRIRVVQLTARGERLAHRFLTVLEAQTQKLRSTWSASREEAATRLLDEISESLDAGKAASTGRRSTRTRSAT